MQNRTCNWVRVAQWLGCVCRSSGLIAAVVLLGSFSSSSAQAITLVSETFDNATGFPSILDPRKYGVPTPPDADYAGWNAARFMNAFADPTLDVGIQKIGGLTNSTPVGIVEDDAGLYFEISTIGLSDVVLSFDWRTFSASGTDRLRVGYLAAPTPTLDPGTGAADFRSGIYAWSNWTELLSGKGDLFQHVSYALPEGEANLIVAFWLDNGEGDYGKFDNLLVTAVPEPSTALLIGLGLAGLGISRRRLQTTQR